MANDPLTVLKHALEVGPNYVGLRVGQSALRLRANGTIEISADVVEIKAAKSVVIKGSGVFVDGDRHTTLTATESLTVQGKELLVSGDESCEIKSGGDATLRASRTLRVAGDYELRLLSRGQTVPTPVR